MGAGRTGASADRRRRGWHLPDVAAERVELDSIDIVEGLVVRGNRARGKAPAEVQVLNVISLHRAARLVTRSANHRETYDGFPVGALADIWVADLCAVRQ